ncbi:MAG: sulfatase-like hydrolase/transferase [Thermomicrobiales bacterium]
MNVIFISIDSLSRHFLKVYGQPIEIDVQTPNLDRFAERALVFDTHYAGSLPCMPARREFFAGIQEFLWRPWGPMEPFDTPLARAARGAGAVSQLVTDHYHYFQHGSHGYYEDYNGFEFIRGHESDAWKTTPRDPDPNFLRQLRADGANGVGDYMSRAAYARNVASFNIEDETDFFPAKVFSRAADWLRNNQDHSKWFLAIDSFDVHEPFHCPEPYASMYTDEDPRDPDLVVWPVYGRVDEGKSQLTPRQIAFVRSQFAGKITMVDRWLGEVLDTMDRLDLWQDTMVVVTTDHGHYLGEHGWMGKPTAPFYNVLAHTPLLIWHPDNPRAGGRTAALTSAVDIYSTVLDALEAPVPHNVHSQSLMPVLRGDREHHRDWAVYGYWGSSINVTDGRYTYFHPCQAGTPANAHSTMMIMMDPWDWFRPVEPQLTAEAGRFLPYTDIPVWRYSSASQSRHDVPMLFDVQNDPGQIHNLAVEQPGITSDMRDLLVAALRQLGAPEDQYRRLSLDNA